MGLPFMNNTFQLFSLPCEKRGFKLCSNSLFDAKMVKRLRLMETLQKKNNFIGVKGMRETIDGGSGKAHNRTSKRNLMNVKELKLTFGNNKFKKSEIATLYRNY